VKKLRGNFKWKVCIRYFACAGKLIAGISKLNLIFIGRVFGAGNWKWCWTGKIYWVYPLQLWVNFRFVSNASCANFTMNFPLYTWMIISSVKLSKFSFSNCQNFPFQTVKIFLFKLVKFSFSNCQNYPFQTVKIFLFKLSKISFSKLSKFSFTNCQNFLFQTVKIFLFQTVKFSFFKLSKFSFPNCQNFFF
jgi:hypothetical protein